MVLQADLPLVYPKDLSRLFREESMEGYVKTTQK